MMMMMMTMLSEDYETKSHHRIRVLDDDFARDLRSKRI